MTAVRELSASLPEPQALEFVYRRKHDLDRLSFLRLMQENISSVSLEELKDLSHRLASHEPPQYILGWTEFCDLRFQVDSRVLIPRPETEELVQRVLAENKGRTLSVLDLGTGSGAIAISLAKERSDWGITATDLSEAALSLAKENAKANQVDVTFVQSDLLNQVKGQYDLIISNPPYISEEDKEEVDQSVQDFEPHLALFAPDQGLALYRKIADSVGPFLRKNGKIYLEIGYKQGLVVQGIFQAAYPHQQVQVLTDSFGRERMIRVG